NLPPHSFVFLLVLMRDAAGVRQNADEALRELKAVANAPVNSIFEHQLGWGIVGGRLYRTEQEGVEAAQAAVRILNGEPTTNFIPKIIGPTKPVYDWRQLRRWKIQADRLPPGSIIKYRVPTTWERYRLAIVGGISVVIVQAGLIMGLILNLRR